MELKSFIDTTISKLVSSLKKILNLDKKQKIGLLITVLGLTFLFLRSSEYVQTLNEAVLNAIGMTFSCALIFSGVSGVKWRQLDSRRMKWLDFIWMSTTLLTATFAAIPIFLKPSDDIWLQNQENISRSTSAASFEAEKILNSDCAGTTRLPEKTCQWTEIIYQNIRKGNEIGESSVLNVCPNPPFKIENSDPRLLSFCINLYTIAADDESGKIKKASSIDPIAIRDSKILKDHQRIIFWKYLWSILIMNFASITLGLRISKSVSELFWMENKKNS